MVLEKQDSGISLASCTDAPDRKMADMTSQEQLLKGKASGLGGSDTKLHVMRPASDDKVRDPKDTASDNGVMSDIGAVGDNGLLDSEPDTGNREVKEYESRETLHSSAARSRLDSNEGEPDACSSAVSDSAGSSSDVSATDRQVRRKGGRSASAVARSHSMHTRTSSSSQQRPTPRLQVYEFNDIDHGVSLGSMDGSDSNCSHPATDLSSILGEREEELVPLHKTVCCALCR